MPSKVEAFRLLSICSALVGMASGQWNPTHAKVSGRTYRDARIEVRAPRGWTIAVDVEDSDQTPGMVEGAVLRKGRYALRLCTACGQTSGISGGRFAEISELVQPGSRNFESNWSPCGVPVRSRVSAKLERVDLWYTRTPGHVPDEEKEDCREPKTTATVWYGSYFAFWSPTDGIAGRCDGYFLHIQCMKGGPDDGPSDEMAFGLRDETTDRDELTRRGDMELEAVLREASAIVRSVKLMPYKRLN